MAVLSYPASNRARDEWILAHRAARRAVDVRRAHGYLVEPERTELGKVASVLTVLLTNRECPWHCLMCDLWKDTVTETLPVGAIPAQIGYALAKTVSPCEQIKLYNSGSFFDPRAIPTADYESVVARVASFERVIVECHPAFVGESCLRFRDLLAKAAAEIRGGRTEPPRLEVAMGLETAHPEVLERLNKRMTLEQWSSAAAFLQRNEIAVRAFVLVKPPFMDEAQGLLWAKRSVEFAFDHGVTALSLIPTRAGNGALEALQREGQFSPPRLATLEAAHAWGIDQRRGRVFADLWDLEKFSDCPQCFPARLERLRKMNLEQTVLPTIVCSVCESL